MNDIVFYWQLGWQHILSWDALDHLVFLSAVCVAYTLKNWKPLLLLVSAFTVGHCISLVLSIFNILSFPSNWVEFLIAVTIVVAAVNNFFRKTFTNSSLPFNFLTGLIFGLIHGLGFANTLQFIISSDASFGLALLGFNIGLECGQLLVVSAILLLNTIIINGLKLSHKRWVSFLSLLVFCFAMKLMVERWPFEKNHRTVKMPVLINDKALKCCIELPGDAVSDTTKAQLYS